MPDTSTRSPADALHECNAHGASGGSKDSTQKTPTNGAATDAQQPQTPCSLFLDDLASCEQQLRDDLARHTPLVGKLQSLGYRTDTSPTRSRSAELMPIRELMQHPQLNRQRMLRYGCVAALDSASAPTTVKVEADYEVDAQGNPTVMLYACEEGREPVRAMAVNVHQPSNCRSFEPSDLDQGTVHGDSFRTGAQAYCQAVARTLRPDSGTVVAHEAKLMAANKGERQWKWTEEMTKDKLLARCVSAAAMTVAEKYSSYRRQADRVEPSTGFTVSHPAQNTVCIDDSGAVGSDFWDRKFAEYMNWEIDRSQTESIVMADPSKAFTTEGELIGRPPLELVTSDKRLVKVAVPTNGSVANLSSSSKGTKAGKGQNLCSNEAWIRPEGNNFIYVHYWETSKQEPKLCSSMLDPEGNVFPLHRGVNGQSIFPTPGQIITQRSFGLGNGDWLIAEIRRRLAKKRPAKQNYGHFSEVERAGRLARRMATHPDSPDATSSDDSAGSWDDESPPPSECDDEDAGDSSNRAALACAKGITDHLSAAELSDDQIKRLVAGFEEALQHKRAADR